MSSDEEHRERLLEATMELASQSGQAIDMVKKHLFHGHPLDREAFELHVIELVAAAAEMYKATGIKPTVETDERKTK